MQLFLHLMMHTNFFASNIKVFYSYLSLEKAREKIKIILYMNEMPLPHHNFDPCSWKLPAIVSMTGGRGALPSNLLTKNFADATQA